MVAWLNGVDVLGELFVEGFDALDQDLVLLELQEQRQGG